LQIAHSGRILVPGSRKVLAYTIRLKNSHPKVQTERLAKKARAWNESKRPAANIRRQIPVGSKVAPRARGPSTKDGTVSTFLIAWVSLVHEQEKEKEQREKRKRERERGKTHKIEKTKDKVTAGPRHINSAQAQLFPDELLPAPAPLAVPTPGGRGPLPAPAPLAAPTPGGGGRPLPAPAPLAAPMPGGGGGRGGRLRSARRVKGVDAFQISGFGG
jgi:hypothetical protein